MKVMRNLTEKPFMNMVIDKYFLLVQSKWAQKMSSLTSDLSKRSLVVLWLGFTILSGCISISIVYWSFAGGVSGKIDIVSVSKPVIVNQKSKENILKPILISPKEYKKIENFLSYMDSLKRSSSDKKVYDSIKLSRPGLLDSLVFIENYYKSNVKE